MYTRVVQIMHEMRSHHVSKRENVNHIKQYISSEYEAWEQHMAGRGDQEAEAVTTELNYVHCLLNSTTFTSGSTPTPGNIPTDRQMGVQFTWKQLLSAVCHQYTLDSTIDRTPRDASRYMEGEYSLYTLFQDEEDTEDMAAGDMVAGDEGPEGLAHCETETGAEVVGLASSNSNTSSSDSSGSGSRYHINVLEMYSAMKERYQYHFMCHFVLLILITAAIFLQLAAMTLA